MIVSGRAERDADDDRCLSFHGLCRFQPEALRPAAHVGIEQIGKLRNPVSHFAARIVFFLYGALCCF